jgi:hypothetical protein
MAIATDSPKNGVKLESLCGTRLAKKEAGELEFKQILAEHDRFEAAHPEIRPPYAGREKLESWEYPTAFECLMAFPGARPSEACWVENQPKLMAAAVEERKAAIETALRVAKTRTTEEEDLWLGGDERYHTLWSDIGNGRSTMVTTMRQCGGRIVIDASGPQSGPLGYPYRSLCKLFDEPQRGVIANADRVYIFAEDDMPAWVRNDDYSNADPDDFELVIILPGRRNRRYAAIHTLAHAVVARAWGMASKSGLFVMKSAVHTEIVNAERECEWGDDPMREGQPRVCIPDLGLRIVAAHDPGGYVGVMDPAPSTIIDCERTELLPVWGTVKLMLGLAKSVTIQHDQEVKLSEFSCFTVRATGGGEKWWASFMKNWVKGYTPPIDDAYDPRDGDPSFDFDPEKKRGRHA